MPNKTSFPATRDHTPKGKPKELRTTFHGVDIVVDSSVLDNWQITDSLYDVQSGEDVLKIVKVLRIVLGDSYHPVVEALESESEDGRLSNEAMGNATQELFKALAPNS